MWRPRTQELSALAIRSPDLGAQEPVGGANLRATALAGVGVSTRLDKLQSVDVSTRSIFEHFDGESHLAAELLPSTYGTLASRAPSSFFDLHHAPHRHMA